MHHLHICWTISRVPSMLLLSQKKKKKKEKLLLLPSLWGVLKKTTTVDQFNKSLMSLT